MIISKTRDLWTDEQRAEFEELSARYNRLWEETPIEEITRPENWRKYEEIDERRDAIIRAVTDKYIKSFARRKTAIYDDIQEIVDSITKEDYLESIKDYITILRSLDTYDNREELLDRIENAQKENYQNCYSFISGQLKIQLRVIVYYNLDRAKVKQIIDNKVSQWYVNYFPDYIPTAHGKATDTLAIISNRDALLDPITGKANIQRENFKLSIADYQKLKGKLGVNTHKLLMYGVGQFTHKNNRNTHSDSNLQVSFFLKDYARLLGYKVDEAPGADPEQEKKRIQRVLNEAQKNVKKELDLLFALSMQWQENIKGKQKDFDNVRILGRVSVRKGIVYMEFTKTMGDYLKSLPITQLPVTQYRIDGRNPNAYALGNKFAQHYNMDSNQKKGSANRLKVETLLKCCPELPTIEQVIHDRNRWEDRIKDRFENALDEVTRAGTIKEWRYTHAKGIELTDEEAQNITDYTTFKELYITFEMGADIDHTERLERQEERKKLQAEKKPAGRRSSRKKKQ